MLANMTADQYIALLEAQLPALVSGTELLGNSTMEFCGKTYNTMDYAVDVGDGLLVYGRYLVIKQGDRMGSIVLSLYGRRQPRLAARGLCAACLSATDAPFPSSDPRFPVRPAGSRQAFSAALGCAADIIKQEVNNPMEVQQNQGSKMLKVTGTS